MEQVQSHLEGSKFHLHQAQSQQVKQYLTLGSKVAGGQGGHPHPTGQGGQLLGAVPVMRNGHLAPLSDGSTPSSPVTLLTLASNHDSEVSERFDFQYVFIVVQLSEVYRHSQIHLNSVFHNS